MSLLSSSKEKEGKVGGIEEEEKWYFPLVSFVKEYLIFL